MADWELICPDLGSNDWEWAERIDDRATAEAAATAWAEKAYLDGESDLSDDSAPTTVFVREAGGGPEVCIEVWSSLTVVFTAEVVDDG